MPQCLAYNEFHFIHNYVMYGYDSEFFYFAGYTKNRKPDTIKLSFEEFYSAAEKKNNTQYVLRKYNRNYKCDINPKYITHEIELYVNGIAEYFDGDTATEESQKELVLGVDCMRFFIDLYEKEDFDSWDMRPMRTFLDHKILMRSRFVAMFKTLNLDISSEIEKLDYIVNQMNLAYMMSLKNIITNSNAYKKNIIKILKNIVEIESYLYIQMCNKVNSVFY